MVNYSTNINTTNNHLSTQLIKHKKWLRYMMLEIQVLSWDRHKYVTELNLLIGSQPKWLLYVAT
jgi:hypothetical protein